MPNWVPHQRYSHSEQRRLSRRGCSPLCFQHVDWKIGTPGLPQHMGCRHEQLVPLCTFGTCRCSLTPGYQTHIPLLPSGTERSQNHIEGGIHSTQGAGSEDYPRYGGYLDQEQSQQHWSSNGKHPLPQPWQFWGYQKQQAQCMSKLLYLNVELMLCGLVSLGGDRMAWSLCSRPEVTGLKVIHPLEIPHLDCTILAHFETSTGICS